MIGFGSILARFRGRIGYILGRVNTVDGRTPAPVDMQISHYLQGLLHVGWCRISSINSTTWFLDFLIATPKTRLMKRNTPMVSGHHVVR